MVDFRYHIVSIVAVFLALGIGIVLGSTALPRPVIDDLNRNVRRLTSEKQQRTERIEELEDVVADDRAFAAAVAPLVVSDRLAGRRVLVVSAPGVEKDLRDGMTAALEVAGATVTGRVRLTDELAKPQRAAELDDLVDTLLPAGVLLTGTAAPQRAASELAAVLGVRSRAVPTTAPVATTRVLSGLAENDFVQVDGETTEVVPAPLVLVLLPTEQSRRTPSPTSSPAVPDPALALVAALTGHAEGVVVAAPLARSGDAEPLAALRRDRSLADRVSSVDGADTAPGRIATVLALANALAGEHGHYGTGSGADDPVPSPVPAATP